MCVSERDRQRQTETETETERDRERDRDRERETETERDRERDRQRQRQREITAGKLLLVYRKKNTRKRTIQRVVWHILQRLAPTGTFIRGHSYHRIVVQVVT